MKKIKIWLIALYLATLVMTAISAYVYAYNNSQEEATGGIWFSLAETEPVPNCIEILDPLDPWTREAIENLSATPHVLNTEYDNWKLRDLFVKGYPNDVFKYHDKYYTFDDGGFFDYPPPASIPLGPVYGGWVGVSGGWVATGLLYKKTKKVEEEK
jgi:hypothetical protein